MTVRLRRKDSSEGPLRLTSAEARVLSFLPTQLSIGEIAERVGRRRSTVKTHVAHIYAKLGVSKRTQAVERARELGLLRDPEGSTLVVHPGKPALSDSRTTGSDVGNPSIALLSRARSATEHK